MSALTYADLLKIADELEAINSKLSSGSFLSLQMKEASEEIGRALKSLTDELHLREFENDADYENRVSRDTGIKLEPSNWDSLDNGTWHYNLE
jgi:hypothetical protein